MFDLHHKTAVVTGGASGIGRAIAERFVAAGAQVWLIDVAPGVNDVATQLGAAGGVVADVSDAPALGEALQWVSKEGLDIMVSNAAIQPLGPTLADTSPQLIRQAFAVNVESVLHGIQLAPPLMKRGGRILNTASFIGTTPAPRVSAYGLSKASVVYLTKVAALELAPRRITVNCVCPGTVRTPAVEDIPDNPEVAWIERTCPLGRMAEPEEVAAAFHYLASDEAAYITGQCLVLDGGTTAGMLEHEVIAPPQIVDGVWRFDDAPARGEGDAS